MITGNRHHVGVTVKESVFENGIRDTRATLAEWNRAPWRILSSWAALSALIAIALLIAVWAVASVVRPDPTPVYVPGVSDSGSFGDILRIMTRNLVVLALHATACVAGFMAGSSIPQIAAHKSGFDRTIHVHAGRFAILLVFLITGFSLVTQALALGMQGASLSNRLEIDITGLMVSVLPHALPELTALFLPLAAWIIASHRGAWHQLLAATLITVAAAIPVLVLTATLEVELWPRLLEALSPVL